MIKTSFLYGKESKQNEGAEEEDKPYCLFCPHTCSITCFFIAPVMILPTRTQMNERSSKKLRKKNIE